jgi:S-formylglutathione hydrolase FrmB
MQRFIAIAAVAAAVIACRDSKTQSTASGSAETTSPSAPSPSPSPKPAQSPNVQAVTFHSDALGVDKQLVLYLPASYSSSPNRHYPVFYYLHGLGGDEKAWTKGGHLDAAADAMKLDAIIVMPDGDDSFYVDSPEPIDYAACTGSGAGLFMPGEPRSTTCVKDRKYETYITKDLVAYIDSHYRTIATRDGRAIAGLSMGGFGALELAGRHPDLYAATASHSGVDSLYYLGPHPYNAGSAQLLTDLAQWGTGAEPIGGWVRGLFGTDKSFWDAHDPVALLTKLPPGKLAIYLDCGTEDDFGLDAQAAFLHDQLTARHIDHAFFLGSGGHNFAFWTAREPNSLQFLRDHTTAAN